MWGRRGIFAVWWTIWWGGRGCIRVTGIVAFIRWWIIVWWWWWWWIRFTAIYYIIRSLLRFLPGCFFLYSWWFFHYLSFRFSFFDPDPFCKVTGMWGRRGKFALFNFIAVVCDWSDLSVNMTCDIFCRFHIFFFMQGLRSWLVVWNVSWAISSGIIISACTWWVLSCYILFFQSFQEPNQQYVCWQIFYSDLYKDPAFWAPQLTCCTNYFIQTSSTKSMLTR